MELGKQQFNSIQRVVKNRRFQVKANSLWKRIHNELGIGEISCSQLHLSVSDHQKLREFCRIETGLDPLDDHDISDRLTAAARTRNEKWAADSVFNGMISVNSATRSIHLKQGIATTPSGTLLQVMASDILVDSISKVLIIENGAIAMHWRLAKIPTELSDALMVYRGHGNDARSVINWLRQLPTHVQKFGYFDFDPSGLGMAVDYSLDGILVPDPLEENLLDGINNKPDTFDSQMRNRPNLREHLPQEYLDIYEWMTCRERKCAITQERITQLQWNLRLLKIQLSKKS
jgi:hypothetical protein